MAKRVLDWIIHRLHSPRRNVMRSRTDLMFEIYQYIWTARKSEDKLYFIWVYKNIKAKILKICLKNNITYQRANSLVQIIGHKHAKV